MKIEASWMIILTLVLTGVFGPAALGAQPRILIEKIPSNLPYGLQEQIQKLYSPSAVDRGYAAVGLGSLGTAAAPALPFLKSMLGDGIDLRKIVPQAQGNKTAPGLHATGDTSPGREAALAMAQMGLAGVKELISALQGADGAAAAGAAYGLGQAKTILAVAPLEALLRNGTAGAARAEAASALGNIADLHALNPLASALKDRESVVRSNAAEALGRLGDRRAVAGLIALLRDDEMRVRESAMLALAKIKDPLAVEPLIARLKAPFDDSTAAFALGEIKDRRAVKALLGTLVRTSSYTAQAAAAEALGKINDLSAIEPLIRILEIEKDELLRGAAAKALKALTSFDYGANGARWRAWWNAGRNK
ncbi:MAG: HEAT repeat domain-containing protein [Candidatus Aminicenantes bacterium]|nr:HEAT repeat domain-containing protein [Candidatus Aminicenantes bacterium]